MADFKFEVGSKVTVLLDGFQCPRYGKFFEQFGSPEMKSKFTRDAKVPTNSIGTVVLRGTTERLGNLYAIDFNGQYYVVGEQGTFGATEEVFPEELDRISKQGDEEAKQRLFKDWLKKTHYLQY